MVNDQAPRGARLTATLTDTIATTRETTAEMPWEAGKVVVRSRLIRSGAGKRRRKQTVSSAKMEGRNRGAGPLLWEKRAALRPARQ